MLSITLVSAALLLAGPVEDEQPALQWLEGPHSAIVERAQREKRPLLTYFWADTANCQRLYSETMSSAAVIGELSHMLLYSANAQAEGGRRLLAEYGLETVPALMVHDADGEVAEILLGFMDPVTLTSELARIGRGENTIPSLRRKLAEPSAELAEELEARRMLAEKLFVIGQSEEALALVGSILQRDPKGTTLPGSVARIQHEFKGFQEKFPDDADMPTTADFEPLQEAFSKLKHPQGRFQALSDLGGYEMDYGLAREGLATYAEAWKSRPKKDRFVTNPALGWIDRIERWGEELTSKDRKFALQVSRDLVALSELPPEPCAACEGGEKGEGEMAGDSCGGCEGKGEDGDRLAVYLQFRMARCQAMNGETKAAIATMKRVTEEAPEEEDYTAYLGELERESEG